MPGTRQTHNEETCEILFLEYGMVWSLFYWSLVKFGGQWLLGGRALQVGALRPHFYHFYQQRVHCRTTLPLLSVRCSCYSCTCAAHKYVLGYLHAHTGQFSAVRVNSLSCTCSVQPCLGTTANSLRGVNFQQTQTSRKTITNVNYFPKFQNLEPACLPPN